MSTRPVAAKIVRSVMIASKTGDHMFNDKITPKQFFGVWQAGRSIKVTGWNDAMYDTAKKSLQKYGYHVTLKRTKAHPKFGKSPWYWGPSMRLYVYGE